MATEALAGPEAPARDDPAAQRAAGWVLGALTVRMAEDRPELFKHWKRLSQGEAVLELTMRWRPAVAMC